jgi:hypothetical protein
MKFGTAVQDDRPRGAVENSLAVEIERCLVVFRIWEDET